MNEHVEDKLVGWSTIIIIFGWIGAVLLLILFSLVALQERSLFLFLMGIAIAADVLIVNYFASRLTLAFAEITQNTRELNLNMQKAFLNNIQATEKSIEEKARLEREQVEREKQEKADREIERKRTAFRRREEYWDAHAEEKEALLAKREQAAKALQSLGKLPTKEKSQLEELIQKINTELNRDR